MRRPVLILSPDYPPPHRTGRATQVQSLADGLPRLDREIVVVAGCAATGQQAGNGSAQVALVARSLEGPDGGLNAWNEALANRACELFEENRAIPRLIHCHDCDVFPAALRLSRHFRVPLVSTIHYLVDPLDRLFGQTPPDHVIQRETTMCRESDALIAVSAALSRLVVETHGVDTAKITVIHPSVDPEDFAPTAHDSAALDALRRRFAPGSQKIAVMAARFSPIKGVSALLRSAMQILGERDDVVYVIAGEVVPGLYTDRYTELAANHPRLRGHVFLTGLLSRRELAALYHVASFAIVPSLFETFGYSAAEAMASGLPTIASQAGGLVEIIEDGLSGLLVPLEDLGAGRLDVHIPSLTNAQRRILNDPIAARRWGLAARARITKRFSPGEALRRTADLYDGLAARTELVSTAQN